MATQDVVALKDFLVDKLGFTEGWTWGEPPMYGGATYEGQKVHFIKATLPGEGIAGAYIWVQDARPIYERLKSSGIDTQEIADRPYGMRDFNVRCPGGTLVCFASETDED
jgi:hypothetical protein